MTKHLTYEEAATLTGIAVPTLYSKVSRKEIPHVRLGPRLVRFPLDELEGWLRAHLVMPTDTTVEKTAEATDKGVQP